MELKVWLPIAISSLSLVVSGISLFISFWRGRYRLKISSKIATLVTDAEEPQNVVIVEVVNNGVSQRLSATCFSSKSTAQAGLLRDS